LAWADISIERVVGFDDCAERSSVWKNFGAKSRIAAWVDVNETFIFHSASAEVYVGSISLEIHKSECFADDSPGHAAVLASEMALTTQDTCRGRTAALATAITAKKEAMLPNCIVASVDGDVVQKEAKILEMSLRMRSRQVRLLARYVEEGND